MLNLLLTNTMAVLPDEVRRLDVGIVNGKIAGLYLPGSAPDAGEVLDCQGGVLMPGAIDTHAHITYCGDYLTGSKPAAQGGVTTVVEMPQSGHWPHILSAGVLERRLEILAKDGAYTDVALWSGIGKKNMEQDIISLCSQGCVGFKIFTCAIADGYPCFNQEDYLYQLFILAAKQGTLLTVHAQSDRILADFSETMKQKGGAEYFEASQPVITELVEVNRICLLSQQTGCKIHICHIASPEILDLIAFWRDRGADVTAETCSHYLALDDTDIVRCGAYAKCGPPLRSRASVEGMWSALKRGLVHTIGSDHAVYSPEEKDVDFWSAPGGFPSLNLLYPILADEGVRKRGLSWNQLARVCSENAADRLGLSAQKGSIRIGLDADFALIDPDCSWEYHAEKSDERAVSPRYPYENRRFMSRVRMTMVRGKIVCKNGKISGAPAGRFVSAGI